MSVGQGKGQQDFSKIGITKIAIQSCSTARRNAGGDYSSGKIKRSTTTTTARRWLARCDSASARRKCNNKCGSAASNKKRKCSRKRHSNNNNKKKKLNLSLPPDDILSEEILTKLPINSLCICKCVSKLWNSLIMHNFYTPKRQPIICTIGGETRPVRFCSIDANTGLVTPTIYNPIDHFFQPICNNGFIHYFGSREIQHLVVFNPATQEKLLVPNTNRHAVHFGFDPCYNKFKFFGWMNYPHQCEIYTLEKKNSSWRTVTSKPIQGSGKFCSMPFCVNGTIYWYTDTRMIVSFNLATETFGLFQGPNRDIENVDYMFEFEGCLCLAIISYYPQRIMDLWMLKDHGNVDSRWVIIARVNKPPGSEIVWTMPYPTRTGELLLAYSETQGSQSFYLYSFFTRQFQDIKICGPDLYYILDNFVENLASLQDL